MYIRIQYDSDDKTHGHMCVCVCEKLVYDDGGIPVLKCVPCCPRTLYRRLDTRAGEMTRFIRWRLNSSGNRSSYKILSLHVSPSLRFAYLFENYENLRLLKIITIIIMHCEIQCVSSAIIHINSIVCCYFVGYAIFGLRRDNKFLSPHCSSWITIRYFEWQIQIPSYKRDDPFFSFLLHT